jgi:hypothetical protein
MSFPETDSQLLLPLAESLSHDPEAIDKAHRSAESHNTLYAVSHAGLADTVKNLDSFVGARGGAFLKGVRAYEVLALGELAADKHASYEYNFVLQILANLGEDANFALHFLEAVEPAYQSMSKSTP